jgi:hypothetical protein
LSNVSGKMGKLSKNNEGNYRSLYILQTAIQLFAQDRGGNQKYY